MSDEMRRTVRTAVQWVVSVAAALPAIVSAAGVPEALPGVALGLGVAAAITRVMALDVVDALLPGWLRKAPAEDGDQALSKEGGR
ncbi:hypothetical protein N0X72_25285 [Streptomyces carpaticus]|uniref:hypothetical protein n=1 Tax=Streptomyces carpaticus TaxID=285558 RepID=UPI0021F9C040|nr:hypothetical protein N0X72_25285 [Streptomyces carpaticus]